jgi:hypothetical protein
MSRGIMPSRAALTNISVRYIPYLPTVVFAVILGYVTAYQPYRNGPPIRSDGSGYHIWTFALKKLDFRFCEYQALGYTEPGGIPGRCIAKWPPGVALFRFPVMVWFVDVDNHESFSNGEHWVSLIVGAGLTLAIYLLGLRILRRVRVDPLEAQVVLFLLFFGTGLFHYGTYDSSFSHIYSAFGSTILMWQLLRIDPRREGEASWWDCWLAGGVGFFMILFRNTNVLIVLCYMALVALQSTTFMTKKRVLIGVSIGSAVAIGIQLSYNHYASGHLAISSYLNESFIWDRPMISSVLFSYERGLFTYYPVVLFVLALGLARRASRTLTLALLSLLLAYAIVYGFWHSWYLGGGFGHRGFVELVPLMIPAVGLGLGEIHDRAIQRWILMAASLTLFIPVQIMLGYWSRSFPIGGASGADYWGALSSEPFGMYFIAGAFVVFAVTDMLQLSAGITKG